VVTVKEEVGHSATLAKKGDFVVRKKPFWF